MTNTTADAGQSSSIWPGLALTALIAAAAFGLRLALGLGFVLPLGPGR